MTILLAALLITVACVVAARGMALRRARSPQIWMLLAVMFGPFPLAVLAMLRR